MSHIALRMRSAMVDTSLKQLQLRDLSCLAVQCTEHRKDQKAANHSNECCGCSELLAVIGGHARLSAIYTFQRVNELIKDTYGQCS